MKKWKIWVLAIRLNTLGIGVSPVLLGAGFSYQSTYLSNWKYWTLVIICLLGTLSLQILSNLVNDYADHQKGVDGTSRVGPQRVSQAGWVSSLEMKTAIGIVTVFAMFIGGILTYFGGVSIAIITAASLLCAYLYTAGPFPLGYNGLGDVFAFIFFGPVAVLGVVYLLNVGHFKEIFRGDLVTISLLPGLFSTCVISVNNLRDRAGDAKNGKRTLAVICGEDFVKWEYAVLTGIIYLLVLINTYYFKVTSATVLSLLILPANFLLVRKIFSQEGAGLNPILADTAKSTLLFCFIYGFSLAFL